MYQELIRKYRRKKLGLLLLILGFALLMLGIGILAYRSGALGAPEPGDRILYGIAAFLMLAVIAVACSVFLRVPHELRRMQESIGITGDEAFAEMLAACEKLPCKEERLIGSGYLFDMVSFRAYRLADIAEVRRIPASGSSSQSDYKVAVICKDGAQCIIPSNHKEIDKLRGMICEAWQRSTETA